jgi:RNA polymerase sigma factor (sigma-70 family)
MEQIVTTADLVRRTRAGDRGAFTGLVQAYQNLALGYAYSMLGDFHQAQDVVQDAFLIAYERLDQLDSPETFAGWLRGIVRYRCLRSFRSGDRHFVTLVGMEDLVSDPPALDDEIQKHQERDLLLDAIKDLPEEQRTVVTLYYLQERSQKDVAEFLEIPVTIVNNRLHEARRHLQGSLLDMAPDTFRKRRFSEEFAKNIGRIVSIEGALAQTRFKRGNEPTLFDVLGSKTESGKAGGNLVVVQRLKDGRQFRCVTTGDVGHNADLYPIGMDRAGDLADKFKSATLPEESVIDLARQFRRQESGKVVHTGIKVIDLLCPIRANGVIGVFGQSNTGQPVLLMELQNRHEHIQGNLAAFLFVGWRHASILRTMLDVERDFPADVNGNVQNVWIIHGRAGDPHYVKSADYLDARLFFSRTKAHRGLLPAIEPIYCKSNALDPDCVGADHYDVAQQALSCLRRAHELTLDPEFLELMVFEAFEAARKRYSQFMAHRLAELDGKDRQIVERARRLESFLTQPFYVAEPYSKREGVSVSIADTINGARRILAGEFDDTDPDALVWRGAI